MNPSKTVDINMTRGRLNLTSIPLKKPDDLNPLTMNTPFLCGLSDRQIDKATD